MRLACNHPCSVTSPRKFTKLPPRTAWWWTAKPTGRTATTSLPSWRGEGPLYTEYLRHLRHESVLCIQCCVKSRKHHLRRLRHTYHLMHWNLYSVSSTPSTLDSFDLFVQYFTHACRCETRKLSQPLLFFSLYSLYFVLEKVWEIADTI